MEAELELLEGSDARPSVVEAAWRDNKDTVACAALECVPPSSCSACLYGVSQVGLAGNAQMMSATCRATSFDAVQHDKSPYGFMPCLC